MAFHRIDKLAVEDEGEGDAVLCIHGLGGTSNTWSALMAALKGRRVIRVDLPGSGRSPAGASPLTIERMAEACAAVCERLGVQQADVLAHSMGTIVAQHLAVAKPKLVRSLVLFGPLIAPGDAPRAGIRTRAAKARSEGEAGMQEIASTLAHAAVAAEARERNPAACAFVRESLMRQEPEGYARSCEALAGANAAAVERIGCPALLVTGDEDTVAPPQAVRAMAERLGEGRAGARVVVLSRCGHWTPIEKPDDCARELRSFLSARR
jgi:pimeloyl-ACP methyl ester carboxylesterase